jgi:hypothetical protein
MSYPYSTTIVTGSTLNSRLNELKKYKITNVFNEKYIGYGSYANDGVDFNNSVSGVSITYYIGGIKFIDTAATSATTFYFTRQGYNSPDFINTKYYKDPNESNIVSSPKINDDVFIIRQELSAFDSNYRLEFIRNLVDLTSYAGGKFFNIVNNT